MADNITLPGTGSVVAVDEVVDATLGTVKVQFVKLMDGTLDGTTKAAVGANGLAVNVTALPAGTNVLGHVIGDASATAGGISTTARLASAAASTNATNVKTTAGRLYSVSGRNNAVYDIFLVLYDAATNPPVPGTTTIRKKIVCPANQAFVYDWPLGLSFATGIGYAFTKLVADADTTVLVAADITAFNVDYV